MNNLKSCTCYQSFTIYGNLTLWNSKGRNKMKIYNILLIGPQLLMHACMGSYIPKIDATVWTLDIVYLISWERSWAGFCDVLWSVYLLAKDHMYVWLSFNFGLSFRYAYGIYLDNIEHAKQHLLLFDQSKYLGCLASLRSKLPAKHSYLGYKQYSWCYFG